MLTFLETSQPSSSIQSLLVQCILKHFQTRIQNYLAELINSFGKQFYLKDGTGNIYSKALRKIISTGGKTFNLLAKLMDES